MHLWFSVCSRFTFLTDSERWRVFVAVDLLLVLPAPGDVGHGVAARLARQLGRLALHHVDVRTRLGVVESRRHYSFIVIISHILILC